VSLDVVVRVLPSLAEFVETELGDIVADLGTFAQALDVVIAGPFEVGTSFDAAQGDEASGAGAQEAQQFTAIHDVPHVAIEER